MPYLRELYLSSPGVTDTGLVHLRKLIELRILYLKGTSVTDAGLIHINALHHLRTLNLKGTAITDAGLAQVRALTGLRWLFLRGTEVARPRRHVDRRRWVDPSRAFVGLTEARSRRHGDHRCRTGSSSRAGRAPESLPLGDSRDRRRIAAPARLSGIARA